MTRVLDFSHFQAHKNPDGTYTVTAELNKAQDAGAVGGIIRSNYGLGVDTTAAEHNKRTDAAGLRRAFYYYPLSRKDPIKQAEVAFSQSGKVRGFCDLEESLHNDGAEPAFPSFSNEYFQFVTSGLLSCDHLTGFVSGIYSSKTWMDAHFTKEQQMFWVEQGRLGWFAHYHAPAPGIPWIPSGWKELPRPWCLWQDKIGPWPGFDGDVDQSVVWPGLDLNVIFGNAVITPPVPIPVPPVTPTSLTVAEQVAIRGIVGDLEDSARKLGLL